MKILILLIILWCTNVAFAQDIDPATIKFDRLTSENMVLQKGLSQNTIYCLLQDRQGYMWFGTWDGLNKYDGYQFTIYDKHTGLA
ncbi:MAG: hypothetical protein B6D64_13110 [Bacteroidetes bacterium 4484_276]|nr:MAG: hypothetical protein B6D64_13110 [Bacteroidetes bacterium 4484_276]